jgi:hypothetical protein
MSVIEWSSTRTASEGHATVGKNPVTVHRRIDDLITWGLSPVACLLPRPYRAGTVPGFLAFCPNGALGDSPGQRPVGWNVAIESRPEGAALNGAEINSPTYPGRRFALPWAISFCPFGAEKKTLIARGLSPVSCQRRKQSEHFAAPPREDRPRFLVVLP